MQNNNYFCRKPPGIGNEKKNCKFIVKFYSHIHFAFIKLGHIIAIDETN